MDQIMPGQKVRYKDSKDSWQPGVCVAVMAKDELCEIENSENKKHVYLLFRQEGHSWERT